MEKNRNDRFEILSRFARESCVQPDLASSAQKALEMASELVGLSAAMFFLFDEQFQTRISASWSANEAGEKRLIELERELFSQLRQKRKLVSAYMSFQDDLPCHTFTLPLQYQSEVFGAVIGFQEGERTIIAEEDFLETLTALLTLTSIAQQEGLGGQANQEQLDKERMTAIVETAVTVNHEVNNPLTAILGNVQLLLMKRDDLDEDLRSKLEIVEESALKIRDVTQKLLHMTTARSVHYTHGTNMIDINGEASDDSEPS